MCGIAVALDVRGARRRSVDEAALREALRRRGPDSLARWAGEAGQVWASRLVLWDEGRAEQPFVGDGLVACFNGELFNLDDLRAQLGLPDASEVEVLARGVSAGGPEFLRGVDGQFAGVVLDTRTGAATAFRDRFGICPLYVHESADGIVLASDLQALLALAPGAAPELSTSGLASVVCEWAAPAPGSAWTGVGQVQPGRAVVVEHGRVRRTTTWAATPAEHLAPRGGDVADLTVLVRASVRSRTRSVGSIAVSLSGGVDSTIVAALATECGVGRSFGLVVPGEDVVEQRQRAIAERLGLVHEVHELRPQQVLARLQEFVSTRRVPLLRLGPVGMTSLAAYVRDAGVSAVLCGEGADELFSGYDSYRVLAARAGLFGPVEELDWDGFGEPEMGAGRSRTWGTAYWRGLVAVAERADMRRSRILGPVLGLLGEDLRTEVHARWEQESELARLASPLDARRAEDLRDLLTSYLLTVQGDHAWMEESVEQRPPWLTNDVASWALNRPADSHVSQAQGKLPVRGVLATLAGQRPELAGMDFDKSAYRLDASFLLQDPLAWAGFVDLVAQCPSDLLDTPAVLDRAASCARAQRCSEPESMLFVLAASLGVLARERVPA